MISLVLNVGLKNARCIAFETGGEILSQSTREVHTLVSNNFVEQDPAEWISHSMTVISEVAKELGEKASRIQAITVTTSASCFAAIDRDGRHLGHSILVSDTRTKEICYEVDKMPSFQALKIKGMKCSPDLMLPKIIWMQRNKPYDFEKVYKFLNVGDFLTGMLCGEYVTDPSNASKFFFDVLNENYPAELYNDIGVDLNKLPKVVAVGEEIGTLKSNISKELGINSDCKVVMSTYDALAAVAGNGAFASGDGVDISGTVTSFRVVTDKYIIDDKKRFYTSKHVNEDQWLVGGSNNLGGGLIEWLKLLYYKDCEAPYIQMENEASSRRACPGGLIFLPHLLGERAPIWNSDCRGVFFGINRAHQKADFTRAVFEGAAFSVAHIAQAIKEYDIPINSITAAGGLSRIDLVNQIKADILGVPVKKFKNFETTAIGAALIMLKGLGEYASIKEAFDVFCSYDQTFEPNQEKHEIYSEYFQLYLKTYESLKESYNLRSSILRKLNDKGINELTLTDNL